MNIENKLIIAFFLINYSFYHIIVKILLSLVFFKKRRLKNSIYSFF